MAVNLNAVGIQSTSLTLCESVDYEQKLEEASALACDSGYGYAATFDEMIEFSLKGSGDLPATMVIGGTGGTDADLTDVNDGAGTETRILTNIRVSESSDDVNKWECSGVYFPNT